MKDYKYNDKPAKDYLTISERSYTNKSKDEAFSLEKRQTTLDFVLWYDEKLLKNTDVSINLEPFKYILTSIDKGYITSDKLKNKNYRLACLIFSKFVQADMSRIQMYRDLFLSENPDFFTFKKEEEDINFNEIFNYNHYQCNRLIFPYLYGNGIQKTLISELISRQFISFDQEHHNIIYVCKDIFDYKALEYHGIGKKHFMRLKGTFPFVYWKENEKNISKDRFIRYELFEDTLTLLQYLSNNYIEDNVLYCSLHTSNYNLDSIVNLRNSFGDLHINFNFENTKEIPEYEKPLEKESEYNISDYSQKKHEREIPKEKLEYVPFFTKEQLEEMNKNNDFSDDVFAFYEVETTITFEEVLEMKQCKDKNGKIYFVRDNDNQSYDIFGNCEELPF